LVSIESLSTNNDNQDMVSLGTLSAWRGREMFAQLFSILAIQAMVLSEAIDQRQAHKQRKLSLISSESYKEIRSIFPPLKKDRALTKEN